MTFEAWFVRHYPPHQLVKDNEGFYAYTHVKMMYRAWLASRGECI